MNNTQVLAERIKSEAQRQGVKVNALLLGCKILDRNLINKLANGKDTGTQNIYKIADALNVSVDYLLGRTDSPNGYYNISNSHTTINGTQANVINSAGTTDSLTEEFLRIFEQLCFEDKVDVMSYVKNKKSPSVDGGKG